MSFHPSWTRLSFVPGETRPPDLPQSRWGVLAAARDGDLTGVRRRLGRDPELIRAEYGYWTPPSQRRTLQTNRFFIGLLAPVA